MKSRELRAAIVLLLDDRHRADSSRTVGDSEISEALGAPLEEVRRQLDILEEQGLTKAANSFESQSAYISAAGMALADELREAVEAEAPSEPPIGFD